MTVRPTDIDGVPQDFPLRQLTAKDEAERLPADTYWIVRYWVRDRYIDCEIQAPTANLAEMMARKTLQNDGIDNRVMSHVSTERQT